MPSTVGPLYLTTTIKTLLIKRLDDIKLKDLFCGTFFQAISGILIGFIGHKFYLRIKKERERRRIKDMLEKERRVRRADALKTNLPDEQCCVVCSLNPKEIILLPCGHVCLCQDCAEKIKLNCPVCRGKINRKAPAFIN